MSASCVIPAQECVPPNWLEPSWYALYLSGQEIFTRGLASYLIKKQGTLSPADVRGTFALQNLLGLGAMILLFASAPLMAQWYEQEQLRRFMMASAVGCYGYALRGVPLALMERNFEYGKVSIVEVLENIIFYLVAIPLAQMGHIEGGLAAAIVLRSWGPTLLAFILKPVQPVFRFRWSEARSIADFGLSVAVASLVNIAIFSVPVVFVGKLSGMKELGQAQMAFSLYSNLLFVTAAVVRLNLNAYARLVEHAAEFIGTVNENLRILAAVLVPIVVGFAGFSPLWTAFVFGQKWQGLSALLIAQAPGYFMAAVFWGVLNPALLVSGKHRQVLCWLMAFAVFYALLTRILTPAYGALGVAIAFSTAEIIFNPVLFWMYGVERLEYQNVIFEIMIGLVFMGCLWISSQNNARAACICGVVYLAVWWTRNYRTIRSATRSLDFVGWCHPH